MFDGRDVVTDYTWNGSALTHKRSYVQTQDIDSKVARVEADETFRYYVGDALGSVSYVLSNSAVIENKQFTNAWGEDLVFTQPTADRHGFTQRERDSESGVMHYRARFYDPRLGRFGGKDPVGRQTSINHYAYASNRPVNRVDPTGLWDLDGMLDEFADRFGEEGAELLTYAIVSGMTIEEQDYAWDSWGIEGNVIGIAKRSGGWPFRSSDDASNEVAAEWLYNALSPTYKGALATAIDHIAGTHGRLHDQLDELAELTGEREPGSPTTRMLITAELKKSASEYEGDVKSELRAIAVGWAAGKLLTEAISAARALRRVPKPASTAPALAVKTVTPSSRALGAALEATGIVRPAETAAHHIVAGRAEGATRARKVLEKFGIGINDAANGVFLPATRNSANPGGAAVHATLHKQKYYTAVENMLGHASTRDQALQILDEIRQRLLRGGIE